MDRQANFRLSFFVMSYLSWRQDGWFSEDERAGIVVDEVAKTDGCKSFNLQLATDALAAKTQYYSCKKQQLSPFTSMAHRLGRVVVC